MDCTEVTYVWDNARECEREVSGDFHRATKVRSWAFGHIVGVCIECGDTVEMEA
jgi:hypothetical protein